jgi:hypothetical protein
MKKENKQKLDELKSNSIFADFYSYYEDKWLQNADWEEKLKAVFGSVEKAIMQFQEDKIFNLKPS